MAMAPSLEKLIELIAKMAGESWIYMGAPMQNSAARNHKPAKENTNVRLE